MTGANGALGHRMMEMLATHRKVEPTFLGSPRAAVATGVRPIDITDVTVFRAALEAARPEVIVHLAGLTGQVCEADPQRAEDVNVGSVHTLIDAARRSGVRRVVFASSAAVYGDSYDRPVSESAPLALESHYAYTQYRAEQALADAVDLETVTLRIFNIFGAVMPNSLVTSLNRSSPERPAQLRGLDSYVRDYIYVDDVITAMISALAAKLPQQHATFNIASGIATTNRELVRALGVAPKNYRVVEAPASYSCADIDSARRWLSFQPTRAVSEYK